MPLKFSKSSFVNERLTFVLCQVVSLMSAAPKWGRKGGAGPDEENLPSISIFSACWPKKIGEAIFGTTVG